MLYLFNNKQNFHTSPIILKERRVLINQVICLVSAINEVYKCSVCGNIVEVLHTEIGTLVCCGKPMDRQKENTTDASLEKHVPVIEKTETGYKIKVGSIAHPMEEKHYIEWIELITDDIVYRKELKPGQVAEAEFCIKTTNKITAREYCNLHGLWIKE